MRPIPTLAGAAVLAFALCSGGSGMAATNEVQADAGCLNCQVTDAVVDENGDGTIDRSEWQRHVAGQFRKLDADNDGEISADEYQSVHATAFDRADLNGDGLVGSDEAGGRGRR